MCDRMPDARHRVLWCLCWRYTLDMRNLFPWASLCRAHPACWRTRRGLNRARRTESLLITERQAPWHRLAADAALTPPLRAPPPREARLQAALALAPLAEASLPPRWQAALRAALRAAPQQAPPLLLKAPLQPRQTPP